MKWLQGAGTEGRVNRGACAATLQVLHYWENQEKKKECGEILSVNSFHIMIHTHLSTLHHHRTWQCTTPPAHRFSIWAMAHPHKVRQ